MLETRFVDGVEADGQGLGKGGVLGGKLAGHRKEQRLRQERDEDERLAQGPVAGHALGEKRVHGVVLVQVVHVHQQVTEDDAAGGDGEA